jgi:hypothetical protein
MTKQILSTGAGIDGACIIDIPSFALRGFGAKISAASVDLELDVLEVPTEGQIQKTPLAQIGGMRHQSSARLVAANHDANVLTVSQDGTVSFFAWNLSTQTLLMIKYIDRVLAAE